MELILIRHAEPDSSSGSELARQDPSLASEGRRQAEAVANFLVGLGAIDYIVSSPARRALETAAPLSQRLRCEIAIDERLRDAQEGGEAGGSDAPYVSLEVDRERGREAYAARIEAYRDSERLARIAGRVDAALAQWSGCARGGRVAAFCHGSVVNVYAAGVLGLPRVGFLEASYASVHRFLISSAGTRSVRSLNETAFHPAVR